MDDAWQQLKELGLPDGAVRPPPAGRFDAARAREAVRTVASHPGLDAHRAAPLLAWLRAWQHHWGPHFAATFGAEGPALVSGVARRLDDENRYLKLRRIAVANLARVL